MTEAHHSNDPRLSPIHVCLASDDRGTVGLAVAVHSVLLHTARPVHVWIVQDGIDAATQERLEAVWSACSNLAQLHFFDQRDLPLDIPSWWARKSWPLASCSRFQLAEILPAEVHRCIYLDIDVLVGTDLGVLYDHDMQGLPIAFVPNYDQHPLDREYVLSIDLVPEHYGNTGVLLMDLDAWRREGAGRGLMEIGRSMRPDLWFFDQDMLNTYFKGRALLLDRRWNFRDAGVPPDGRIQHFAGRPKPWQTQADQATDIGMVAWHRARAATGFVPTEPSTLVRAKRRVTVGVAWLNRQMRRRARELGAKLRPR